MNLCVFLKCKIVAMFLQFKKIKICCKFVVLFWSNKFTKKGKTKYSTNQKLLCKYFFYLHDMWVVEYETLLMWKILTW
jgi:hypothetical protein